jgi:hypothetical protein
MEDIIINGEDGLSELRQVQDKLISENPEKYTKGSQKGVKKKLVLNVNLCLSLIWVYKYYRYCESANKNDYYTKKDFFFDIIGTDYEYIIKNFTQLRHWDLLAPMPTHPTEIKYKKGWWGITDFGIKFCQREIAMPKYAIVQDGMAVGHITKPVMIDELLEKKGYNYDDLINKI